MPRHRDLKRLVRARMLKTGESYTAARAQLVKRSTPVPPATTTTTSPKRAPSAADYATLAGMSDATIRAKTGCGWEKWVRALDHAGATTMTHGEIAAFVVKHYDVTGWWSQAVTVGYERIRGIRAIGQRRDGSYEASKSKTVAAPVGRLYRAFTHAPTRRRWLPEPVTIRTAVRDKTVRITWEDQTSVEVYFVAKGAAKCQIAIQHRKLADRAAITRWKAFWNDRLGSLSELIVTP